MKHHHRPYRTVEQARRDEAAFQAFVTSATPNPDWEAMLHGLATRDLEQTPDDDEDAEDAPCACCNGTGRALIEPADPTRSAYWGECWECGW